MRKINEINQAIAILLKKGGRVEAIQAEVLTKGMTEKQAFDVFVANISDDKRDEAIAYGARDAARFAASKLTLDALIPDAAQYDIPLEKPQLKKEKQVVNVQEFESLKRKVKQLEGFVDDLLKERRQRAEYQKLPDTNRTDFIGQKEATELIGCSRETLSTWQRKGLITGYRKAGLVYYSKSELVASPVVINFLNLKK